jgi:hypothetical protein
MALSIVHPHHMLETTIFADTLKKNKSNLGPPKKYFLHQYVMNM